MNEVQGAARGAGRRVGIAVSRFNPSVTGRLLQGAVDALKEHGVDDSKITAVWVPGAFELPTAARWLLDRTEVEAVICLGAVIRGETAHFDYVCEQTAAGIMRVALDLDRPVTFGVLTTDNTSQAVERAGGKAGNNGADAAL
ncbi:MAG: 6,7-dimethyl-8-ribityllumazine synthase, partial [Thermaerobacterales bacterium]